MTWGGPIRTERTTGNAKPWRIALLLSGRTQAELAKTLGVSQPTVARWLAGAEPHKRNFVRIQRLIEEEMA